MSARPPFYFFLQVSSMIRSHFPLFSYSNLCVNYAAPFLVKLSLTFIF